MKRLFLTFAAVLLMSVSAFAQSASISKCDVNEDGKVDVADITAIISTIKSMQRNFYLGTIEPTAENHTRLPELVTTYTSIEDALGTTVSVDAGQTVYLLCPTSWIDQWSNPFIEDISGEAFDFSDDIDVTTIPEYSIYKTQTLNETSTMTLKIQHQNNFYVGVTSKDAFTLSDLTEYKPSRESVTSITVGPAGSNTYQTWIYPASWGRPVSMISSLTGESSTASWNYRDLYLPEGYTGAWRKGSENVTFTIIWEIK